MVAASNLLRAATPQIIAMDAVGLPLAISLRCPHCHEYYIMSQGNQDFDASELAHVVLDGAMLVCPLCEQIATVPAQACVWLDVAPRRNNT